jgi:hypothetical protein
MANRNIRFILKNNANSAAPFSGATIYAGEPIVNTAAGIMMFSGVTSGTNDWTPAGTGGNANFFEVGSNLYNLKIRNQITSYAGFSNLSGKFLSGSTNGFVLADISTIAGIDTYVTGGTPNNTTRQYVFTNNYGGTFNVNSLTDIFVTGATVSYTNANGTAIFTNTTGGTFNLTGLKDTHTTGATFNAGTATFTKNDGTTYTLTGITATDTYVTGFTYNPSSNLLTILQNEGQVNRTVNITTMSGLTLSNLTAGRVVYVGTSGLLTDEAGFTYDAGTNTFSVPSDGTVNVGTGGLNVTGNAIIQGDLTVLGAAISAFTNQLYVEDPNITLNYNPTGNTTATSIGAGWTIQDGNGVNGGNVNLDIRALNTLTGLTSTQVPNITEYTTSTGYANRGWVTQLNDIVIRSTNLSTPNGVRVIAEFDVLDGGSY